MKKKNLLPYPFLRAGLRRGMTEEALLKQAKLIFPYYQPSELKEFLTRTQDKEKARIEKEVALCKAKRS